MIETLLIDSSYKYKVGVVRDSNGNVWAFYYDAMTYELFARKSTDNGATFDAGTVIGTTAYVYSGQVSADDNGHVYLYYTTEQHLYCIEYDGSSWSSAQDLYTLATTSIYSIVSDVTILGAYHYVLCLRRYTGNNFELVLLYYDGADWTTESIDTSSGTTYTFYRYRLAVDSSGNLIVVWLEQQQSNGSTTTYYRQRENDGTWGSIQTMIASSTVWSPGDNLYCTAEDMFYWTEMKITVGGEELRVFTKDFDDASWTETLVDDTGIPNVTRAFINVVQINGILNYFATTSDAGLTTLYQKNGEADWGELKTFASSFNGITIRNNRNGEDNGHWDAIYSLYPSANHFHIYYIGGNVPIVKVVEDNPGITEQLIIKKTFAVEEVITVDEGWRVPFYVEDNMALSDSYHIRKDLRTSDGFLLTDSESHYQLIHPKENLVLSDTYEFVKHCIYVRWLLDKPVNDNFSFENFDKGFVYDDSMVTVERYHEKYHYHALELTFASGGIFSQLMTVEANTIYIFWFDYYNLNMNKNFTADVLAYPSRTVLAHFDSIGLRAGWNYWNVPIFNKGETQILVEVKSNDANIVLDNFALVRRPALRNPETFGVPYTNKETAVETLQGIGSEPMLNYTEPTSFNLQWSLLKYAQKTFLESLKGEKILVRTHDMKSFPVFVKNIKTNVPYGYEQLEQRYDMLIECAIY